MDARSQGASLLGCLLLVFGATAPWVRRTGRDPDVLLYVTGMDSGVETLGALTLAIGLATVPVVVWTDEIPRAATLSLAASAVVGFAALSFLLRYPPTADYLTAGAGVYLTLLGAILVGLPTLPRVASAVRGPSTVSTSSDDSSRA